jgi:hypothetical protein
MKLPRKRFPPQRFFSVHSQNATYHHLRGLSQELLELQDVARYVDHTLACYALRRSRLVSTVRDKRFDYARQSLEERWQNR